MDAVISLVLRREEVRVEQTEAIHRLFPRPDKSTAGTGNGRWTQVPTFDFVVSFFVMNFCTVVRDKRYGTAFTTVVMQ
jgi:hypothetical protein